MAGLIHGATTHGLQRITDDAEKRREPLISFTRGGPVGDVFGALQVPDGPQRVGIVGLGAGALASYARPGDHYTYFEIDPVVVRIARDSGWFSFLAESRGKVDVVLGDARLTLATHADEFDVLVIDAFSSDAIPLHLLTREAVRDVYLPRLAPNGVLVLHISNGYLTLNTAVAALAADLGLVHRFRELITDETTETWSSAWSVLAREESALGTLARDARWKPVTPLDRVWTDDFSNVFAVIDW